MPSPTFTVEETTSAPPVATTTSAPSPTVTAMPVPSVTIAQTPTTDTPEPSAPTEVEPPPTPADVTTNPPADNGPWTRMDVTVQTAAEAQNLTQTSPDFQAFVAERVSTPDASGCQSEFTVQAFHPAGFAAGQDFAPGCGGSQNIWGMVGGQWGTIMAMQSVVSCTEMAANNIPQGLPDIPCLDADGEIADW